MSSGFLVLQDICWGVGVGLLSLLLLKVVAWVGRLMVAFIAVFVSSGETALEHMTSIVRPELSSRTNIVRRACSSRDTIIPARQMNWMGWFLR